MLQVMAASITSLSIALSMMPTPQGGFDFSALTQKGSSGVAVGAGSIQVALQNAEKNEAKQLKQVADDPMTKKDIERYTKVAKAAKKLDDVLNDPIARKVFLKANGLGDQVDAVALAKKALASDPSELDSLANRMAGVNGNWIATVKKYRFDLLGVNVLKSAAALKDVTDNYVGELRLDSLDQQVPGLGSAILFKRIAKTLDTPIKILGSALGRDVVTTALGLPKQIALQSLEAQSKAITQRLDPKKLKDPEFVDKLIQRYLIQLNGGMGGITA